MDPDQILAYASLLDSLGSLGLLVAAIVALLRGMVVTAGHHKEIVTEKDERIKFLLGALDSKCGGNGADYTPTSWSADG